MPEYTIYSRPDATTLVGQTSPGELLRDATNGTLYVNAGSTAAPNWMAVAGASTLASVERNDDFLGSGAGVGELNWNNGGTGGSAAFIASEAGHPGIQRCSSGGTSTNFFYMIGRSSPTLGTVIPADLFDIFFLVRLNTNDANTAVRIGLANDPSTTATASPNDGLYFEKLAADTGWFAVNRASSVQTKSATAVAATSTGWVMLRLRRIDAATIGFSADGGAETRQTTNIPTTALQPSLVITTATAASKNIDIDYFRLRLTNLAR